MQKRTFDEIDKERSAGYEQTVYVPPVRTSSGMRFGYAKKVDFEELYFIKLRREAERVETVDRLAIQKEREEVERKKKINERLLKIREERKKKHESN